MPHHSSASKESVLYNPIPSPVPEHAFSQEQEAMWDKLMKLRADVNKALELARADKIIGKPLDAEVTLFFDDAAGKVFDTISYKDLKTLFIVSGVKTEHGIFGSSYSGVGAHHGSRHIGTEFPGVTVAVIPSEEPKCSRCWVHDKSVGDSAEHPELCARCLSVVQNLG